MKLQPECNTVLNKSARKGPRVECKERTLVLTKVSFIAMCFSLIKITNIYYDRKLFFTSLVSGFLRNKNTNMNTLIRIG